MEQVLAEFICGLNNTKLYDTRRIEKRILFSTTK